MNLDKLIKTHYFRKTEADIESNDKNTKFEEKSTLNKIAKTKHLDLLFIIRKYLQKKKGEISKAMKKISKMKLTKLK